MSKRIIAKRYYRVEFRLAAALAVGSGENLMTDKDLVRDGRGVPYIPASALAGVYRSLFEKREADRYFGPLFACDGRREADDSRIVTYDAVLLDEDYRVSTRNCVGLDEWKTAMNGAKFDFEILEPGVRFVTYIEQNKKEGDCDVADVIADTWLQQKIAVGGKNSRGLGRVDSVKLQVAEFSMTDEAQVDDWLDFRMYEEQAWKSLKTEYKKEVSCLEGRKNRKTISLHLDLLQRSPITVRTYTTQVTPEGAAVSNPDYMQMTYLRDGKEIPVIPGTTWAGAFRHQMRQLDEACMGLWFGANAAQKSKIRFGESEIEGAVGKITTRSSVDRFTGGVVKGALFTEKMYWGGHTGLDIELSRTEDAEQFVRCLAAAVVDLHMGFLSIGGETSIGHGLFTVTGVALEGKAIEGNLEKPEELYRKLVDGMLAEMIGKQRCV